MFDFIGKFLVLFFVGIYMIIVGGCSGESANAVKLSLSNVNISSTSFFGPPKVSYDILNTGAAGEAYVWVEQGGQVFCPSKVLLGAGERRSLSFVCNGPKEGNMIVYADPNNPSS